jgi:cytochrome c-type biogenesis protein CcmF
MTVSIGNFSLGIAVLASALSLLCAITGGKFGSDRFVAAARWFRVVFLAAITVGAIALLIALVQSDFQIDYVARYTERGLSFGYKLAAFWAGQEGSLLLWAWLLAVMSAIAAFTHRSSTQQDAAVIATLAIVCGFFAALILCAANPFKIIDDPVSDGHGLNPMLQDPGMIAHPPMLFLGYAGFTIPFAFLVGALIARRRDNEWVASMRPWIVISWLALSVGILLGANWAYVELGWGGYWAWDPVENASLLPWLTGTALLHSIMVQQQRGMFKKWNAGLVVGTFVLCIFGTYLTRSGVIDSVHSFPKSLIGTFFLAFLGVVIALSLILITVRRALLKPDHELIALSGKEGFFLATNVLLVGMTAIVLIGTIFPLITDLVGGQKVTVSPSFYNKVVAPLGLLLVALMSVGPLLAYGKDAAKKLAKGMILPVLFAAAVVTTCTLSGLRNAWALIAAAIVACAVANILADIVGGVMHFALLDQINPFAALIRLFIVNHRRYGAQLTHVGMLMIVAGVVGSSVFSQKDTFAMKEGDSVSFAGRSITLVSVDEAHQEIFQALQATLRITDSSGVRELHPQIRQYAKWEELSSQVSIRSTLREDLYLTLAATDGNGGVTIQAIVNPLVSWIWIGGIVLSAGAIIALIPRITPKMVKAKSASSLENKSARSTAAAFAGVSR